MEPLTPADIAKEAELNDAIVWGLDPGLTDIFVASDGDELESHRIRKTSTSEYYQMAGFNSAKIKRSKYDRSRRDARNVVSQIPSTKTINHDQFNAALRYIFGNFEVLRGYNTEVQKKLKFQNYRQRQKALNEMYIQQNSPQKWKPLSPKDGQDEKNRPVIVAFGAARFGNLGGTVPSPTKKFKAALLNYIKKPAAHIQRNDLHGPKYVVMTDEHLTSQICPICKTRTTSNQVDADNLMIHSVLNCQSCDIRWNRDHMAENNNELPEIFQRGQESPT